MSAVQSPVPSSDVFAEMFAAGTDKVGSILSTTVTSCEAVAVLPDASVTVQVTVVVPTGKLFGASFVVLETAQLSAVTGVPNVTFAAAALHWPASTFTVTSAGAVIVGSMLSTTVTVCVAVTSLPLGSTAVHVTVVVPTGKLLGASLDVVTLQLSAAVGLPRVTFAASALHAPASTFTVTLAGAVSVGSILSTTVTVWVEVTSLPLGSTAVHVTVVVPTG